MPTRDFLLGFLISFFWMFTKNKIWYYKLRFIKERGKELQKKKLILASASPRRRELLNQVGIKYKVQPSDAEMDIEEIEGTPIEKTEKLAYMKAKDIAARNNNHMVIGADTIVVIGDEILGKPKDKSDAIRMLTKLNGREHQVITGIALIDTDTGRELISHEVTYVKFRNLTDEMIEKYAATGEPEGKAGAYAIQGIGAILVEGIRGCYSNVVGLPLARLGMMLERMGRNVL